MELELQNKERTPLFLKPAETTDELSFVYRGFQQAVSSWTDHKFQRDEYRLKRRTRLLNKLLERGAKMLICTLQSDPDTFLGFVIYQKIETEAGPATVIHFTYTKKGKQGNSLRKQGVAKAMLAALGIEENQPIFISMTSPILNFDEMKKYNFIHIPHLADI